MSHVVHLLRQRLNDQYCVNEDETLNTKGTCGSCPKHRLSASFRSKLQGLPYELHLYIGRMLVIQGDHPIVVASNKAGKQRTHIDLWDDLIVRLLPFASAIDNESLWRAAATYFFRHNCFQFTDPLHFGHLQTRFPTLGQLMTDVEISVLPDVNPDSSGGGLSTSYCDQLSVTFPNLRRLKIHTRSKSSKSSMGTDIYFNEHLDHWLEFDARYARRLGSGLPNLSYLYFELEITHNIGNEIWVRRQTCANDKCAVSDISETSQPLVEMCESDAEREAVARMKIEYKTYDSKWVKVRGKIQPVIPPCGCQVE